MSAALAILPYVAFFLVVRAMPSAVHAVEIGLWAAFATGLANLALMRRLGRKATLLQTGTLALFALLAMTSAITHWQWTMTEMRLAMDGGFLAIILASVALGRPFTMEYARRRVPEAFWGTKLYMTVNRHITLAWAAAFALLAADTGADLWHPDLPIWFDLLVSLAVMATAIRFTIWYPGFARRRAGNPWAAMVPPSAEPCPGQILLDVRPSSQASSITCAEMRE